MSGVYISAKVGNAEQASILAVSKCITNGNKSQALRLLILAGWEKMESSGDFKYVAAMKKQIEGICRQADSRAAAAAADGRQMPPLG